MASDDSEYEEEGEEEEEELELEEEDDEDEDDTGNKRKSRRSQFIDDAAEEDEDEEEEEEDDHRHKEKKSKFIDDAAIVADSEEDESEEDVEGLINDDVGEELPDLDVGPRGPSYHQRFDPGAKDDDPDAMEAYVQARYASQPAEVDDVEASGVEQKSLLPSVKDPKLWMVKCKPGHEREAVICLMQKFLDKDDAGTRLLIKSATCLDHLKGYLYVEAEKEHHVLEACKGMRMIYTWGGSKPKLVPIKEMPDVLTVTRKSLELEEEQWVRIKAGAYKGDLSQVMEIDQVRQQAVVRLIPRLDLAEIAAKMDGTYEPEMKKKTRPQPHLFNIQEAKEFKLPVEQKRDQGTGEFFQWLNGDRFKDGFLFKSVALRSVETRAVVPSFDELQKFQRPSGEDVEDGLSSLAGMLPTLPDKTLKKKVVKFVKGDTVRVFTGELKNLTGTIEHVDEEEGIATIIPSKEDMGGEIGTDSLEVRLADLRKSFKAGDHVKVLSGQHEGTTGLVVGVDDPLSVVMITDTTQEQIRVFAHDIVEATEVNVGLTKFGDYELHDLVQLDQATVGMIIRVDRDSCQVLLGTPDKQEVRLVQAPLIRRKVWDRKNTAQDKESSSVSIRDIVRVAHGDFKGKQGPVEHIYRGLLYIHCRDIVQNGGYICVASRYVKLLGGTGGGRGGSRGETSRPDFPPRSPFRQSPLRDSPLYPSSPSYHLRSPSQFNNGRGGLAPGVFGGGNRGHQRDDDLVGRVVKVKQGPYKGYRGRVTQATETTARLELDSIMKAITVRRDQLMTSAEAQVFRDSLRGRNAQTPSRVQTPSQYPMTPAHPGFGSQTPMRDPTATPMHEGMRTPSRDRAWNPQTPFTPSRDGSGWSNEWNAGPAYTPYTPATEGPPPDMGNPPTPAPEQYTTATPASTWVDTPRSEGFPLEEPTPMPRGEDYNGASTPYPNGGMEQVATPYAASTPGQPITPGNVASPMYMPGTPATPGGIPGTPGDGLLEPTSPGFGASAETDWAMPNIAVSFASGDVCVIQALLPTGSCILRKGASGDGEEIEAAMMDLDLVLPKKNDRIKIVKGEHRGATGKLIGIDGVDGIVKMDDNLEIKILDMNGLGKLVSG